MFKVCTNDNVEIQTVHWYEREAPWPGIH